MHIGKLIEHGFILYTDLSTAKNSVTGLYCCDLLSMVLAKAKSDDCLITVQNHLNTIAVATVLSLKAIVFVENLSPDQTMIEKANQEGIALLSTNHDSATVIHFLSSLQGVKPRVCL